MKRQINEPDNGILTDRMDIKTKGFDEFQSILLMRSRARSVQQKQNVELLSIRFEMEDYVNSEKKEIKSAGDFLKLILRSLQIQQNKFANYIGIKPSNLSKLINGERSINYDLALIFGRLFNHDPLLWIEIQAKNELRRLLEAQKNKYYNYSLNDLKSKYENINP